jgi:hypothetical protein
MKNVFLCFMVVVLTVGSGFAQDFQGAWSGTLDVGSVKLRLTIEVFFQNSCAHLIEQCQPRAKYSSVDMSGCQLVDIT